MNDSCFVVRWLFYFFLFASHHVPFISLPFVQFDSIAIWNGNQQQMLVLFHLNLLTLHEVIFGGEWSMKTKCKEIKWWKKKIQTWLVHLHSSPSSGLHVDRQMIYCVSLICCWMRIRYVVQAYIVTNDQGNVAFFFSSSLLMLRFCCSRLSYRK